MGHNMEEKETTTEHVSTPQAHTLRPFIFPLQKALNAEKCSLKIYMAWTRGFICRMIVLVKYANATAVVIEKFIKGKRITVFQFT